MSWYKKAREIQELVWDPDPNDTKDDYDKMYLDSDKNAVMENIYNEYKDTPVKNLNIDMLFNKAVKTLSSLGGESSMWSFFLEENQKDSNSDKGRYLEKLKKVVRKEFSHYYKKRKEQDNKAVVEQPNQPQLPPPMGA